MSAAGQVQTGIPAGPIVLRPRFFAGATHEEALSRLHYLVESGQRCGVVTGSRETGKSMVLRVFAQECVAAHSATALVDLTDLGASEALERLAEKLALAPHVGSTPDILWRHVTDALAGQRHARERCVILFDHLDRARSDCHQVVERLLAHDGGPRAAVFVLGFSGQSFPIVSRQWRQLADLRVEVTPLTESETTAFVRSLVDEIALPNDVFDADALEAVFDITQGTPGAVVRLCQLALLSAIHDEKARVSSDVVEAAMSELSLLRFSA
jgi:general secretion pathway protein A